MVRLTNRNGTVVDLPEPPRAVLEAFYRMRQAYETHAEPDPQDVESVRVWSEELGLLDDDAEDWIGSPS